jgi:hypothetical protein
MYNYNEWSTQVPVRGECFVGFHRPVVALVDCSGGQRQRRGASAEGGGPPAGVACAEVRLVRRSSGCGEGRRRAPGGGGVFPSEAAFVRALGGDGVCRGGGQGVGPVGVPAAERGGHGFAVGCQDVQALEERVLLDAAWGGEGLKDPRDVVEVEHEGGGLGHEGLAAARVVDAGDTCEPVHVLERRDELGGKPGGHMPVACEMASSMDMAADSLLS